MTSETAQAEIQDLERTYQALGRTTGGGAAVEDAMKAVKRAITRRAVALTKALAEEEEGAS